MRSAHLKRFLENYRRHQYRTTVSGHRVRWDEPGEANSPEIRRHNAALEKQRESKDRLKRKGAVPTRNGKPIFEQTAVKEDVQQVLMSFRRAYQSNRPMRFREWIRLVAGMLEDL